MRGLGARALGVGESEAPHAVEGAGGFPAGEAVSLAAVQRLPAASVGPARHPPPHALQCGRPCALPPASALSVPQPQMLFLAVSVPPPLFPEGPRRVLLSGVGSVPRAALRAGSWRSSRSINLGAFHRALAVAAPDEQEDSGR